MRKGSEVVGTRYANNPHSIRYHMGDRRNRAYKCGCMPNFRIGDKICYCASRDRARYKDRVINYNGPSTTNLWWATHPEERGK